MSVLVLECGGRKVVLWLNTTQDPSQEAWDDALKVLGKAVKEAGDLSKVVSLVITDGGAPNALQRKQHNEVLMGPIKSAVVTNALSNPLKRGIATAILWLNPSFRAYQPTDFDRALQHLGLEDAKPSILVGLKRLQESLPPNSTLSVILTA